jgi:type II secretory pathway component PulF
LIGYLRDLLSESTEGSGASRARAVFFRSLCTLMESGVHIVRSLEVLAAQTEHPPLKRLLQMAVVRVSQGQSLHRSLQPVPGLRSPLTKLQLQLIAVGERSGSLHRVLARVARNCEREDQLEKRLVAALVYPLAVLVAALGLVILLQNFVFKDLLGMLVSTQTTLPWPTRVLAFSSRLTSSPVFWIFAPVLLGCALRAIWLQSRSSTLRKHLWSCLLRVPALRTAMLQAMSIQFARALSTCMTAGVPLPLALELSGQATLNPHLCAQAAEIIKMVIDGRTLSNALAAQNLFPPLLIHCIAAGESVGRTPMLLEKVSDSLEDSLDQSLDAAASMIQPVVLLLVGALVGFIVLATLLPMVRLVQNL